MAADIGGAGDESPSLVSELRWKVGAEAPPFVRTNAAVVRLLLGIVDNTIDAIPSIVVSEAVAIYIYHLVFDRNARATELKQAGVEAHGLYTILASLAFGRPCASRRV